MIDNNITAVDLGLHYRHRHHHHRPSSLSSYLFIYLMINCIRCFYSTHIYTDASNNIILCIWLYVVSATSINAIVNITWPQRKDGDQRTPGKEIWRRKYGQWAPGTDGRRRRRSIRESGMARDSNLWLWSTEAARLIKSYNLLFQRAFYRHHVK